MIIRFRIFVSPFELKKKLRTCVLLPDVTGTRTVSLGFHQQIFDELRHFGLAATPA